MRLLKETADQISPSLTMLFNKSLRLGIFPGDWKLANIVPIFKKGKRDFVENYRPISIGKRELAITLAARENTSFWQISRLVPFILTGTQATGYSSRSHLPRIAGYIWGTTRIPTRADIVSVVCG